MRDYSNIPVLKWSDPHSLPKAKNQVLHEEPVIIAMDDSFTVDINAGTCGCRQDKATGIYLDGKPAAVLVALSKTNQIEGLAELAEAARHGAQRIDVDPINKRLIIHD